MKIENAIVSDRVIPTKLRIKVRTILNSKVFYSNIEKSLGKAEFD
jgi:hypothetical protein